MKQTYALLFTFFIGYLVQIAFMFTNQTYLLYLAVALTFALLIQAAAMILGETWKNSDRPQDHHQRFHYYRWLAIGGGFLFVVSGTVTNYLSLIESRWVNYYWAMAFISIALMAIPQFLNWHQKKSAPQPTM